MTPDDRYDVSGLPEAQFEPGSNEQVLKNRLGIVSTQDMDDTEAKALEQAMDTLIRKYDQAHRFTASDICECHRTWLGDIYEWAGHYRQVNVIKGDFPFAAATHIPLWWNSSNKASCDGVRHVISRTERRSSVL